MRLFLFMIIFVLVPATSFSITPEKKPIGRNEDGKAYRTDASGFQIVDHMAELEVTVDDLRRQVRVLEDELERARNSSSSKLAPAPVLPGDSLKEKDLISSGSDFIPNDNKKEEKKNDALMLSSLTEENQNLKLEIDSLKKKVENISLSKPLEDDGKSKLESALKEKDKKIESLLAKIDKLEGKRKKVSASSRVDPGALSKKERNVLVVKLSRIQKLITKRKGLADGLRCAKSSVRVSFSPLRTKKGVTLDKLRAMAKNKRTRSSSLSSLKKGLAEIEYLLIDDISVMKRLSKGVGSC